MVYEPVTERERGRGRGERERKREREREVDEYRRERILLVLTGGVCLHTMAIAWSYACDTI